MTTPELTGDIPEHVAADQERLAAGLRRVRRVTSTIATERWLATAGGVLMPLGVVLVLVGWYASAHTTRLFEQIPYLISAAMLGIVLSGIGAACYFGYWLTRLVQLNRQMVDTLAAIQQQLADTGAVADDVALVATKGGALFHRADCSVVAGRPAGELRKVSLPTTELLPCKLCSPLGA